MATKAQKERKKIRYSSAKERVADHGAGFQPTSYQVPEGVELLRFESEGKFYLDPIPHVVGEGNPFKEEGEAHYEHTYWVHPRIGPEKKYFPCNRKNKKGDCRCAGCDSAVREQQKPDADEDYVKSLKPQERQLWLFRIRGDKEKKLRLYDAAHYGKGQGFGEMVDNFVDALDAGDPRENFQHLQKGFTFKVNVKEKKFPGGVFKAVTHLDFVPRDYEYPDSLLDKAPVLEDLVNEADYDEFKKCLLGIDAEEETDDEDAPKPKKGKKGKPKDDEEDEVEEEEEETEDEEVEEESEEDPTAEEKGIEVGSLVTHEEHGDCEVVHVSKDGTSLRLKTDDGDVIKGIAPGDCELREEEEEKPKKKGKKKPKEEEPEEEDEEELEEEESEDEEEEEDAPKPKKGKKGGKSRVNKDEEDDDLPFEDEDLELEDEVEEEEEEDEPKPKKKGKAPPPKKKRK